jgi:glutathione S-transferase
MTLKLYDHPLSSYCWKVLIALYELGAPFERALVNYGDPASRDAFFALWPFGKIPVLVDGDVVQPETTVIVERVNRLHGGGLIPADFETALEARTWDRVFDGFVITPMNKIVADSMRAEGEKDPRGVADARAQLQTAYGIIDARMKGREWAVGEAFSLADCAAAPALFYARTLEPFGAHAHLGAYFERLVARPSFARVLDEARPVFQFYPYARNLEGRFHAADRSGV